MELKEFSLPLVNDFGEPTNYSRAWYNLVLNSDGSNNAVKILADQYLGRITGRGSIVFPSKEHWIAFALAWDYI